MPLATAAVSGGGIGWFTTFLQEKQKSRAYMMGAVDQAVQVALQSVTAEVARLNGDLDKLRGQHKECREENDKLRDEMDELRENIDKLMSGKVPGYER
jgi:peptidoglycan hydrolase CwlO-like protein